ncbi:hypothetical protein [Amycolatopsis sp. NBC_01480]|uniref:hypothetical protein n=1 Tax=Amycolatopsis sp. NBC_01480 TaxID=2903562 RepID=UPI002E29CA48|nr:hypothetical protein [Amycolatopsis sp. NBC_01480]
MSSIPARAVWKSTAYSALIDAPNLLLGGSLVAIGVEVLPIAAGLAAVPLGLAFGRMYRAHDRAVEVRDHLAQRARQVERARLAELPAPLQAAAVREDVEPIAVLEEQAS